VVALLDTDVLRSVSATYLKPMLLLLQHACAAAASASASVSDIIARFERKGYKLVGIKVMVPTRVSGGTCHP
jgi:hypothetical protein